VAAPGEEHLTVKALTFGERSVGVLEAKQHSGLLTANSIALVPILSDRARQLTFELGF
jgi:hypothetical protein